MSDLQSVQITSRNIGDEKGGTIAVVSLNKVETANAFNDQMIHELSETFKMIAKDKSCRLMILKGNGKHFSAGADLKWMQNSVHLDYSENLSESKKLAHMFQLLYDLPIPTIAVVKGAAFGGAVGLTACCDYAIGAESAKFCLSEVKLGILPAVIMPYLEKKMRVGSLLRYGFTAKVFSGKKALESGLIDICCKEEDLEETLKEEINGVLQGGSMAQKALKTLQRSLSRNPHISSEEPIEAIAKARQSQEAKEGFKAFFNKSKPSWVQQIDEIKDLL